MRGVGSFIESVVQDVRYGVRLLKQSPWFSLVAVVSLAVGLGSGAGLFTLMNAALLRPLPGRDTASVHAIFTSNSTGGRYSSSSYPDFESFVSAAPELFAAACATTNVQGNIASGLSTQAAPGAVMSGGCFDVLGLRPHLGRLLNRTDDQPSATSSSVVISHTLWRRSFHEDPAVVGREITVNGVPAVIVGVAEAGFHGVSLDGGSDFWVTAPLARVLMSSDPITARGARRFRIYVRLNDGITAAQAAGRLALVAANLRAEYPESWTERNGSTRTVTVTRELDARFAGGAPGAAAGIATATFGAIAAIVVIACINLATILVARGVTRTRELNIRLALGASRRRLLRQLAIESLIISAIGCAAGLLLVATGLRLFEAYRPVEVPAFNIALDWRVMVFSTLVAMAAPVLFGLAPGAHALRVAVAEGLRGPSTSLARFLRVGPRELLVLVQVTVSFALLIMTALFMRSLMVADSVQPGSSSQLLAIVPIDPNTAGQTEADSRAAVERLLEAARRVPGVEAPTAAALVPMTGSYLGFMGVPADRPGEDATAVDGNVVAPGYFELVGTKLRAGRTFTSGDHDRAARVAIVSESLARRYWDTPAAFGRSVRLGDELREVVGVVADVPYRSSIDPVQPMIYVPLAQSRRGRFVLHARVQNEGEAIAALDRALRAVDPRILIGPATPMRHLVDQARMPARMTQGIGGVAGLLQLGLALMAIWGLVAYAVERRRAEIAIRRALGATETSVVGLVMRPSLWLLGIGGVAGCAAGVAIAKTIHSEFLGLAPIHLSVVIPGAAVLTTIVVAASWLPARRAASVEPATALKGQ